MDALRRRAALERLFLADAMSESDGHGKGASGA